MSRIAFIAIDGKHFRWKDILELRRTQLAAAYADPAEQLALFEALREDVRNAGLLAITSPDRLHAGWLASARTRRLGGKAISHIESLLAEMPPGSAIVTILDGHPAALAWLGAVRGQRVVPLGVDRFGQSGDLVDLYREYGLDEDTILRACAAALLA